MEKNNKKIVELVKKQGNNICADCCSKDVQYASYNIGVFLCARCANIHHTMGSHISKVKHLQLDHWEDSQIERLKQVGNNEARYKYEQRVPAAYRRPNPNGNDPPILVEQWIFAKYLRNEFYGDRLQSYLHGQLEGFLLKKGREDPRFYPRRCVLENGTWRYYVKDGDRRPKAVLPLEDVTLFLAPAKLGNGSSMQISYLKDGSTRHIYVCHEDPEMLMQWYHGLRIGKMLKLKELNPNTSEIQLLSCLPQDPLIEGWLWKAGPSPSYTHRRRWCTLDYRKLMYHNDQMDAYAKGEIFIGSREEEPFKSKEDMTAAARSVGVYDIGKLYSFGSYRITLGGYGVDKFDPPRHSFSLHTPYRTFVFSSESLADRDRWVEKINEVMDREFTAKDIALCANLVRKRLNGLNALLQGR